MSGLYRPNVAAVVVTRQGKLLICERSGKRGAWQFPQGGVDPGETADEALARELEEETGYVPADYDVVGSKGNYRYDYPAEVLQYVREKRKQPYVGQEQTYYLCRLHPDAPEPALDHREFECFRWILPHEFQLEWLPPFKRDVYRAVMKDFFDVDLTS